MGNLETCFGYYFKIFEKVDKEEQKYFNQTKKGVTKTVENIKETFTPINN